MIDGEISPLFGLTLLELVEDFGIIGLSIGVVTAILLYHQFRRTARVHSAQLLVDYVERVLEKNQPVLDILRARVKDTSKKFEERKVLVLLNGLENIIQFSNDKVLDKKQVLNVIGNTLRRIKNDVEIKKIVEQVRKDTKDKKMYQLIFDFIDKNLN